MGIQFIVEVYVCKNWKKKNSMASFYGQDSRISRFCATTGL